jgi:hypothetical protein
MAAFEPKSEACHDGRTPKRRNQGAANKALAAARDIQEHDGRVEPV